MANKITSLYVKKLSATSISAYLSDFSCFKEFKYIKKNSPFIMIFHPTPHRPPSYFQNTIYKNIAPAPSFLFLFPFPNITIFLSSPSPPSPFPLAKARCFYLFKFFLIFQQPREIRRNTKLCQFQKLLFLSMF